MLLCQQMRPHHVPLWQIWHRDQRTQLGGGQGSFHVSLSVKQTLLNRALVDLNQVLFLFTAKLSILATQTI